MFFDHVKVLLSQARREGMYRMNRNVSSGTGILQANVYMGDCGPATYVAEAGEVSMVSEPAELLQRLYCGASSYEQRVFAETLPGLLNRENARVVARTL